MYTDNYTISIYRIPEAKHDLLKGLRDNQIKLIIACKSSEPAVLDFLQKVVFSTGLKPKDDVGILHGINAYDIILADILAGYPDLTIIIMGLDSTVIVPNMDKRPYRIINISGSRIVFTDTPERLMEDKSAKLKLWGILKSIYIDK